MNISITSMFVSQRFNSADDDDLTSDRQPFWNMTIRFNDQSLKWTKTKMSKWPPSGGVAN